MGKKFVVVLILAHCIALLGGASLLFAHADKQGHSSGPESSNKTCFGTQKTAHYQIFQSTQSRKDKEGNQIVQVAEYEEEDVTHRYVKNWNPLVFVCSLSAPGDSDKRTQKYLHPSGYSDFFAFQRRHLLLQVFRI